MNATLFRRVAVRIASLLVLLPLGDLALAQGVPTLLDFDAIPVGTPVHTFPGLTLVNFDASNFDGSPRQSIVQPALGTISGTHALQSDVQTGIEFGGTHLTIAFDLPQSRVTLSTGLADSFPAGTGALILMQGYEQDPNISGFVPIVQALTVCLGHNPTAINNPLELFDPQSRIKFAFISEVACDTPTQSNSGPDHGILILDNLSYERELNPPAHESDPPIVSIVEPVDGSTVIGNAIGILETYVHAIVQEADLAKVTATVNGKPAGPVVFGLASPGHYTASVLISEQDGLVAGSNTVTLTATDFDTPPNTGTATTTFVFQPKPAPPPSMVDILPTAFDVTQAIDTGPHFITDVYGTVNGYEVWYAKLADVPLLKGRPTMVRVFGAASGTSSVLNAVPAAMDVDKENCANDCILARAAPPIAGLASGTPLPRLTGITVQPLGAAANPSAQKQQLANTWNFLLPAMWTTDDLAVRIVVNQGQYPDFKPLPSVPECFSGVALECTHNNELLLHLHFQQPNELVVNPVFLHVNGNWKGTAINNATPSDKQFDTMLSTLNQVYPVDVVAGVRQDVTIGPDTSYDDLVDVIDDASGFQPCLPTDPGNNVWLGIFPDDQAGANPFEANSGGVAGAANLGSEPCAVPSGWVNADDPIDSAHEIGHVIGFDHWGCEHQGDEECHVFPIAHGGIGGVGVDVARFRIVPQDFGTLPAHSHDFMVSFVASSSKWVSWFTYQVLSNHFTFSSYDAPDPRVLIVRGRIASNGLATLRPVYRADIPAPVRDLVEDDIDDIWTMRGFDGRGNVLWVHNFEPEKVANHQLHVPRSYAFVEPVLDVPGLRRIAIYKGPRTLGELRAPGVRLTTGITIASPAPGERWIGKGQRTIRWKLKRRPEAPVTALVLYSADGGKGWRVIGRDVKGDSLSVDTGRLPGGNKALITVQISDGLNTEQTRSKPFYVAPKAPGVHIMWPATGSVAYLKMPQELWGRGYDRQERLDATRFRWVSSLDGYLGTGPRVSTTKLSAGTHHITLTVKNSSGMQASDAVDLTVQPFGTSPP